MLLNGFYFHYKIFFFASFDTDGDSLLVLLLHVDMSNVSNILEGHAASTYLRNVVNIPHIHAVLTTQEQNQHQ